MATEYLKEIEITKLQDSIKPNDSASNLVSRTSQKSHVSSMGSAVVNNQATQAALREKAKALNEMQRIQIKKMSLDHAIRVER